MPKNVDTFDQEVKALLRRKGVVPVSEIRRIGEKYGLNELDVAGRLSSFTKNGIGYSTNIEVYVSTKQPSE